MRIMAPFIVVHRPFWQGYGKGKVVVIRWVLWAACGKEYRSTGIKVGE